MIYKLQKIEFFFIIIILYKKNMQKVESFNNGWGQFIYLDEEFSSNKKINPFKSFNREKDLKNKKEFGYTNTPYEEYNDERFLNIEESDYGNNVITFKNNYQSTYATAIFYNIFYIWDAFKDALYYK